MLNCVTKIKTLSFYNSSNVCHEFSGVCECVRVCVRVRRGCLEVENRAMVSLERTGIRDYLLPFRNFGNFVDPTLPVSFGRD